MKYNIVDYFLLLPAINWLGDFSLMHFYLEMFVSIYLHTNIILFNRNSSDFSIAVTIEKNLLFSLFK